MLEVRYAKPEDRPRIIEISDIALGPNYLKPEHFEGEWKYHTFVVAVWHSFPDKQQIVGFSSSVVEKGEGYLSDVAVLPGYERRGIGSKLVVSSMVHLWNLGVRKVHTHAWEYPDGTVRIQKAIEAAGFVKGKYLPEFYYKPEEDYVCTQCGNPCHCSAYEFTLEMDDSYPVRFSYV